MKRHEFFIDLLVLMVLFSFGCSTPPEIEPHPTQTADATAVQPPTIPTTEPTPTLAYIPAFETAVCQFTYTVEVDIHCGYLIVPEDRAQPERMIRLHVAIIASKSSNPAPDPVVYLNGGPGGHTLFATNAYVTLFDDILSQRDLILFDQRGTGYSEPALDCPETIEEKFTTLESDRDAAEEQSGFLAALTDCHDRLTAAGINLSAYNSAASAADLDELRQVLGIESWNLLGISYGTRLALTAMRDFGSTGTIRSAVLDSVIPLHVDFLAEAGIKTNRAFELLFARCLADDTCNQAYPDLETRFYQLVDALKREPTVVLVSDPLNHTTYRIPFTGDDLINTLFDMMHSSNQITTIPRMLARLEQNGKTELAEWLSQNLHGRISEGMNYSVQCAEERPFFNQTEFTANNEALPPQLARFIKNYIDNFIDICAVWQVETAVPLENEPVSSDIPTLILSGDYDPATPPYFAETAVEYLRQAYVFELAGQSHGIVGSSKCGMELVVDFLDQPNTPPDGSCLENLNFGFVTN